MRGIDWAGVVCGLLTGGSFVGLILLPCDSTEAQYNSCITYLPTYLRVCVCVCVCVLCKAMCEFMQGKGGHRAAVDRQNRHSLSGMCLPTLLTG